MEAVARPERVVLAAPVPFVGGVRWSFAVGRRPAACLWPCGAARRGPLPPDSEWQRVRSLKNKEEKKMVVCATTSAVLGAGPLGPLTDDFPAAGRLSPIQAIRGVAADPARHRLVLVAAVVGVQKGLHCNFLFVLDFSVRSQI